MVQDVEGTPTEIGGIKTTLDVGQGYYVNVLNKTTLGGIQGILNAHQETELLSVGDEVTITVNGSPWIMQVAGINNYNSHDVMLTSKYIWTTCNYGTDYTVSQIRAEAQNFYSSIISEDKQYIKQVTRSARNTNGVFPTYTDYCFVLGNRETVNDPGYGTVVDQVQMPLFATASSRIKTYNGTAIHYFLADCGAQQQIVTTSGTISYGNGVNGVVPSFMLIADV